MVVYYSQSKKMLTFVVDVIENCVEYGGFLLVLRHLLVDKQEEEKENKVRIKLCNCFRMLATHPLIMAANELLSLIGSVRI